MTNGNAITVDDQKPMLDNSIEKDCLVHQMYIVPATINPEKSLLWDSDPGPSSPSRTCVSLTSTLLG